MRLFIAIDPPAQIAEKIASFQRILEDTRAEVRWTQPHNYHITIKFLGETDEKLLPEIPARLAKAAAQVPQFELEVEGVSRFPERGPVRVVVSRIFSPDQRLTKLHRLIDSGLGGIGLPMDTRVLVPHLTLGRIQSNHGLNRLLRLLEKHDLDFFGKFTVATATLYQSTLTPNGSVYRPIHTAALAEPKIKTIENVEIAEDMAK